MTLRDIEGREINVGDRIAYPGRQGSSLWMNKATVLDIDTFVDWRERPITCVKVQIETGRPWQKPGRITSLTVLDKFVKL